MKGFTKLELTHVSGSIEMHDYTVQDEEGNFFTFVPGDRYCAPFYISTFEISRNPETGEPQSAQGFLPWVEIRCQEAERQANKLGGTLLSNEQYDRVLRYIVETEAATEAEMYRYSTRCGNYWNNPEGLKELAPTGSNPKWWHNGIADIAGNTYCWVEDEGLSRKRNVVRGSGFCDYGCERPASSRHIQNAAHLIFMDVGFRVALDARAVA